MSTPSPLLDGLGSQSYWDGNKEAGTLNAAVATGCKAPGRNLLSLYWSSLQGVCKTDPTIKNFTCTLKF
jgi:hypothetical protein